MENSKTRVISAVVLILFFLITGTFFFHVVEGWKYIDAFYYTGVTLTTVGYGDFTPTKDISKIVSVLFAFAGIGIVFYSVSIIAQNYFERNEKRIKELSAKHQGHDHFKLLKKPFSFLKRN